MKAISILGSTGSVGVTTLDVVGRFGDRFRVVAMAAGRNLDLLTEQVNRFHPELVSVATPELARELATHLGATRVTIMHGLDGAIAVATHPDAKLVMSALVGAMGLQPTLAAINAGKDIAFANKEVLVIAGELITSAVRENRVRLLPVDSEHNAVFQCLEGRGRESLKRIILTASGGPFRELPADRFEAITIEQALKHPTWVMGSKITIDSATLMNKGLEVIEARWLFDLQGWRSFGGDSSAERDPFDGRNDRRLGDRGDGDSRHGDSRRLCARVSRAAADDASQTAVACGKFATDV